MTPQPSAPLDADVAIVGYGPVGQTVAALLGQYGHRVVVIEPHPAAYPLPPAVGFDGEVRRIFHRLGIDAAIEAEAVPVDRYEWIGADGELALNIDFSVPHPSGWSAAYLFYQPTVEQALDEAARRHSNVSVNRGWRVDHVNQFTDHAELTISPTASRTTPVGPNNHTIRAKWVIGADGANSVVRSSAGIPLEDFGFAEHWLVVDVRPHDINAFADLPRLAQFCDPHRPCAIIANGSTHRRWEFMLVDDEQPEDFTEERVWQLLTPYIRPDEGTLIRRAVYQFRSLSAASMQDRRILLAGDSAHLMPPFMGRGMCSGLADAGNLAWKLDLVLRGIAAPALLESYTTERKPINDTAIEQSLQMGQFSCMRDAQAAAQRDAALRAGVVPPSPALPAVQAGIRTAVGSADIAGTYAVQPVFQTAGGPVWADDLVGPGFTLLTTVPDEADLLGPTRTSTLHAIGARHVSTCPGQPGYLGETDGRLEHWLAENALAAAVVRPDGYAFGGVCDIRTLPELIDDLITQLGVGV
jgi:2-polyprenyl-6-methoxyphenol hydroxylase-like FAD-dependent oxidoreductase